MPVDENETITIAPAEEHPGTVSPLNGAVIPAKYLFKPGESGNQRGRKTTGAYIKEYINMFGNKCRTELRAIVKDQTQPVNAIIAARRLLSAASAKLTTSGMPVAGADFDRIMDRTEGKPAQTVNMQGEVTNSLKIKRDSVSLQKQLSHRYRAMDLARAAGQEIIEGDFTVVEPPPEKTNGG
jgi:hypothetical protein